MKVSFDFDSTLDIYVVQDYAKELVQRGVEVWIVTSRLTAEASRNPVWNDDVFAVAKYVGIKKDHINFCNMEDKYLFFKRNEGFLWHLDDDREELEGINQETPVVGILRFIESGWRKKCDELLEMKKPE